MAPETARQLRELPKGDALATAQLAGIMAAKRTSELIPLCHPLPLTHVEVALEVGDDRVRDHAPRPRRPRRPASRWRRSTAATVAALTVYDMAKAIDKEMVDRASAPAREDEGAVKAAVLTVSDGVAAGTREDASGDVLAELLAGEGYEVERRVVADERERDREGARSSSPATPRSC